MTAKGPSLSKSSKERLGGSQASEVSLSGCFTAGLVVIESRMGNRDLYDKKGVST